MRNLNSTFFYYFALKVRAMRILFQMTVLDEQGSLNLLIILHRIYDTCANKINDFNQLVKINQLVQQIYINIIIEIEIENISHKWIQKFVYVFNNNNNY